VAPTLSFVAPKKLEIKEYEGSLSTFRLIRREFSYDDATTGNLISTFHHGDTSFTGDEREETATWAINSSLWLHKPIRQAVSDGSQGSPPLKEKWIYYDGLPYGQPPTFGLITKEEINTGDIPYPRTMGDPLNAVTTYTNDPDFGVRTSVTDPRGCTTTIEYEATKTFQTKLTNCLNPPHIREFTFDPRHGGKLTDKDPNQQITTTEYDGFGRVTKSFGPLDSATYPTVSFDYVNWGTLDSTPSSQHVKTSRREQHGQGGTLDSWEYFNGLGQVDFTKQEGPDASKFIVTDTVFNGTLPKIQKSAPYFVDGSHTPLETAKLTTTTSDLLGRPTLIQHPNLTDQITYEYFVPGKVKITDERGKVRWKHFDAYGQLIQIDEINQGATQTTTFKYDAAGNQIQVKNALNHYTSMAYDMAGRKRAMCDPNMGTSSSLQACSTTQAGAWVYTYNPAGDLLTQKDAKNQTLTFEIDLLGRPTFKKQGTTTLVEFTYDTSQISPPPTGGDFPVGRLTKVNQPQTSTTALFAYDKMGRTIQSKRQLLGVWHKMSQQFDALSRVTVETFPDDEQVTYNYNTAGLLQAVLAQSGLNYINDIQYNGRGQKTQVTYGNNLVTNWGFNPDRFFVTSRVTSNNQQNLTYTHDPVGNILTITDAVSATGSRTFTYDDLMRLSTAVGNFGPNQSSQNCTYVYSAIGNIDSKCGTTFSYGDAMHPSAVTYNPATNKSYTYDNNGNMITRGNQTLAYDIENRVTSVTISGGGSTSMEYDHTGIRLKKNALAGITLFPFARYEIDPSGVITKFIQIGVETFAAKKGTDKLYYHTDHLGSVHVITDSNGARCQINEYDPWGGVSRSEGPTPGSQATCDLTHRFTGKELDPETGLYYYGGRYYDPEISRFISPDPFVPKPGVGFHNKLTTFF
jgi:RHS repeat-associated protein